MPPVIVASDNSVNHDLHNSKDTTSSINKFSGGENDFLPLNTPTAPINISEEALPNISEDNSIGMATSSSSAKRSYTKKASPPLVISNDGNEQSIEPAPKKKRAPARKSKIAAAASSLPLSLPSSLDNFEAQHEASDDVETVPYSVQAVLDGTEELSFLKFDELEVYIFAKKSLSYRDISYLSDLVHTSVDEVDKCYFMRDMLSEFVEELDETDTIKLNINGLIYILANQIDRFEKTTISKGKALYSTLSI